MYIINCIYHCIFQTDKQEFGNRTFHYGSIADRSDDWCLILFDCRLDTAIFKRGTGNRGMGKGTGNGERGIFKSGHLLNGESLKAGIFKMGNL